MPISRNSSRNSESWQIIAFHQISHYQMRMAVSPEVKNRDRNRSARAMNAGHGNAKVIARIYTQAMMKAACSASRTVCRLRFTLLRWLI
jgi:hypothetical protein